MDEQPTAHAELELVSASTGPLIPLCRPALGDAEARAAERVLRSGRLILGPENEQLERRLAALAGRRHAVCVSSGTTALELGLAALAGPGGLSGRAVLVPACGFPAAAHAVIRLSGRPVPVDVDARSWNLDPDRVGDALGDSGDVAAVVSIDAFGVVSEAEALERVVAGAGVPLLDDAACALGGHDSRGRPAGSYGKLGTFSFHPRKIVTTGEGGAIVCDDDDLARALRELRNHGQALSNRGRVRRFVRAGTNARLAEVAAAIGCVQLDRLDALLRERALLCDGYRARLAGPHRAGKLSWQEWAPGARPAAQTFAVLLAPGIDRARVQAHLAARGVETGVATFALHELDSYLASAPAQGRDVPVAGSLHQRGLALPLYIGMRSAELDRVSDALTEALP